MKGRDVTHAARAWIRSVALVLFGSLLIRATVVQAYHITSGSMEDSFLTGDVVLADRLTYGTQFPDRIPLIDTKLPSIRMPGLRTPSPGDVIIVESPEDASRDLFKRVVAVEGQVVEIRDKVLQVDGKPFQDAEGVKHIDSRILPSLIPRDNFGPVTVPAGHLFVMGDNRDNSYDSRYFGPIPVRNVKAHPLFVYFSRSPGEPLWHAIRWSRLGLVD